MSVGAAWGHAVEILALDGQGGDAGTLPRVQAPQFLVGHGPGGPAKRGHVLATGRRAERPGGP